MNLLSVIYHPVFGGPHNRHAHIVPILRELGVATTVVLPDDPGNAAELLRGRGVPVVTLPLHRLRDKVAIRPQLNFAREFRKDVARIRGLVRRCRADAVLVNGLLNPHAAIAAWLEDAPVVWQLLDTVGPQVFRQAMTPMVNHLADAVMTTGMSVAHKHPGLKASNSRLVPFFPPVDTTRFVSNPGRRAKARRELGLDDSDFVVGNVGNLAPIKGHRLFVRAAAELKRLRPRTRFVILGSNISHRGDYVQSLEMEIASSGLVLGRDLIIRAPEGRVPELEVAFDLFWLTSETEGLPTVVGEAHALGLPVVATDVGSVAECVIDGRTGFLIPPGDARALVEKSVPLVDDIRLRHQVGRRARLEGATQWDPRACARAHLSALEVAVRAQHRR